MKDRIKRKYGSLRQASAELHINYHRLVNITSGWIKPNESEIKQLEITQRELKETLKVQNARTY